MPAKVEIETRQRITDNWASFQQYHKGTESHAQRGRTLNESDVRAVLERLLTDVLGYEPSQIDREPDFADFVILYRGMKLIVIETKDWEAFRNEKVLENALRQAANYADRHKVKYIFAFDGETLVHAVRSENCIETFVTVAVKTTDPHEDVFYFTHYGLDRYNNPPLNSIGYAGEPLGDGPFKSHHGVKLPHASFAYIGDLRDTRTWKMPYRNADGTVDTGRIDKAVSYLFSKSGYRGVQASERSVPEVAQPEVARKLAIAYREMDRWEANSKYKSVNVLWNYLDSRGETDLK